MSRDSEYREQKTREGKAFERAIAARARAAGFEVIEHESKEDQLAHGDLRIDGVDFEVKLDKELVKTGNLYIEVDELTRDETRYVSSGIFASARWKYYLIGDYNRRVVLPRPQLQERARDAERRRRIVTAKDGLGHGFLIRWDRAVDLMSECEDWVRASASSW